MTDDRYRDLKKISDDARSQASDRNASRDARRRAKAQDPETADELRDVCGALKASRSDEHPADTQSTSGEQETSKVGRPKGSRSKPVAQRVAEKMLNALSRKPVQYWDKLTATQLYEVTHLTPDAAGAAARIAALFGLDAGHFVPIRSENYGYDGSLTLFDPDRLDRIETIHPYDAEKTMGRFFAKGGPCLYMCYCEADDVGAVRERLLEHAPRAWTGTREGQNPDGLFIHPRALGGAMLGVSRTTHAWTWSGSPARVRPAAAR